MQAEILIQNGSCLTMRGEERADWVALGQGRILAVGQGRDYEGFLGEETAVLDAEGKTVLPGFVDSHFHVIQTARNAMSLDLIGAKSFEEIGAMIRRESERHPGKQIRGIHLEAEPLKEGRFPDRFVLDQMCSDVPVALNSSDYQVCILNTHAMMSFKIPFRTPGIETDGDGRPTGVFRGAANAILYSNILNGVDDGYRRQAVSELMGRLLSNGITTLCAMEGGRMYDAMAQDPDAEFLLRHRGEFPVDMEIFYQTMDLEKVKRLGLSRIGGALYLDGTIGGRTAALSFEYADCPGSRGSLCAGQEGIRQFVRQCYENRLQLALFAIGDRAVELALDSHEYALRETGITGLRHRLEHVELANRDQMRRAQELGILFSMQPAYEQYWGGADKLYAQRLGNAYRRTNCFREITDSGIVICGGSDSDVTEGKPLLGIHTAVNHPVPEHRIGLFEALRMFTVNGAYGIFQEREKGTLEPGKMADVIILDGEILSIPKERISELKVAAAIKSGELLHNRL